MGMITSLREHGLKVFENREKQNIYPPPPKKKGVNKELDRIR